MTFKVDGAAAIFFESDGRSVLVTKGIRHEAGAPIGSGAPVALNAQSATSFGSLNAFLTEGYVENYFAVAKNQGETSGYASGGLHPQHPAPTTINVIDKWPFSSDANATDVGDLTSDTRSAAGISSPAHGYVAGGYNPSDGGLTKIARFAYASDGNAVDHGDLTAFSYYNAGSQDKDNGYSLGGFSPPFPSPTADLNFLQKFPFANSNGGADQGDLSTGTYRSIPQTSPTHIYMSGGRTGFASTTITANIRKTPFASLTSVSVTGDLTQRREEAAGAQSTTHGYTAGGKPNPPPPAYSPFAIVADNVIDKFPFASDADATDVGDLFPNPRVGHKNTAGQSSTTHGYMTGGEYAYPNEIHKYTFAADNNSTDVGDMTVARGYMSGHQF